MSFKTIPNENLKIRKQEMTCDGKICDDIPPPLSCYSASYMIVGSAGSGKTNWITSILGSKKKNNMRQGLKKCFDHVIICSPSLSTLKINIFSDLDENKRWTEFNDAFLDYVTELTDETSEEEENTLVILDDVTSQLKKNMQLQRRLTYLFFNRRHRRITFFLSVQRSISVPLSIREAITHVVMFRPRNLKEVEHISNEYLPIPKSKVNELLSFVFDKKYNFLFIDMSLQNSDKFLFYKNFDLIVF